MPMKLRINIHSHRLTISVFIISRRNKINQSLNTGWPKKVSHYIESSLNRIRNCQCGYISHQFWV